jgi:hypothetical protein
MTRRFAALPSHVPSRATGTRVAAVKAKKPLLV